VDGYLFALRNGDFRDAEKLDVAILKNLRDAWKMARLADCRDPLPQRISI